MGVIEFFSIYLILPAALWPLTEMSTRNVLGSARKADNLTATCEQIV
jgi:hypothetical protein